MTDPAENRRPVAEAAQNSQAFWTVLVGAPALLSVLRLWVEAGGDLQTTLLLVANVGTINLITAIAVTTTWLVTTALVAVFAIGGVLSAGTGQPAPLLARWAAAAPMWLKASAFLLAALTWKILYLPLLLLAACAAFQLSALRGTNRIARTLVTLVALGLYAVVFGPTVRDAWRADEGLVVLLFVAPPLLAVGVAGALVPAAVRPVGVAAQIATLVFLASVAFPVLTTPVLPLTVTVVQRPGDITPTYVRGYVIEVDDVNTVVLEERGGVRFVDNDHIESQELCGSEEDLPRYRLWVRGFYIEDSILRGLGRQTRPVAPVSPPCRLPASPQPGPAAFGMNGPGS